MKKTIRFYDKGLTFQCDGRNKKALSEELIKLQELVIEFYPYLAEGAQFISHKISCGDKIKEKVKSLSGDIVGLCREEIRINGTVVDSCFGITLLTAHGTSTTKVTIKELKVKDIEKAIDNIQLLINESSLKPKNHG